MNKKMKVISKQRNSKMCIICGLDNKYGLKAPFYNMEDGSVMTKFQYSEEHQSYPGRVHGGLITAMLDEMGLRALWAKKQNEEDFGVTIFNRKRNTSKRKLEIFHSRIINIRLTRKSFSKWNYKIHKVRCWKNKQQHICT